MVGSLHRITWVLILATGLAAPWASALALDSGWPRTLPVGASMVTIYEPQLDGMDGDVIRYRAALAPARATCYKALFSAA